MTKIKCLAMFLSSVFIIALSTSNVYAQKYKSLSDTTKLNKDYGQLTLELSKLNTRLIAEQNKTAQYQSKIESTSKDAVSSGQTSKESADVATNGETTDTKKAMKDAKKANNQANDAQDAKEKLRKNGKKIDELNLEIAKKQQQINDLDSQRTQLMGQIVTPVVMVDSSKTIPN